MTDEELKKRLMKITVAQIYDKWHLKALDLGILAIDLARQRASEEVDIRFGRLK